MTYNLSEIENPVPTCSSEQDILSDETNEVGATNTQNSCLKKTSPVDLRIEDDTLHDVSEHPFLLKKAVSESDKKSQISVKKFLQGVKNRIKRTIQNIFSRKHEYRPCKMEKQQERRQRKSTRSDILSDETNEVGATNTQNSCLKKTSPVDLRIEDDTLHDVSEHPFLLKKAVSESDKKSQISVKKFLQGVKIRIKRTIQNIFSRKHEYRPCKMEKQQERRQRKSTRSDILSDETNEVGATNTQNSCLKKTSPVDLRIEDDTLHDVSEHPFLLKKAVSESDKKSQISVKKVSPGYILSDETNEVGATNTQNSCLKKTSPVDLRIEDDTLHDVSEHPFLLKKAVSERPEEKLPPLPPLKFTPTADLKYSLFL
ncbi:uncharacterized protein LOC143245548 [Tachypleus tridentatus]|uniref:uncharacterized protein LOC143245548 n=1 Tax=Tachypleus tridentatus TaxID=6853 RepID=UPI003FD66483